MIATSIFVAAAEHAETAPYPTDLLVTPHGVRVIARHRDGVTVHQCSRVVAWRHLELANANLLISEIDSANRALAVPA